jgi:hypothetical protein
VKQWCLYPKWNLDLGPEICGKEVVWSSVGSSVLAWSGNRRGHPGVGILA